MTKQFKDNWHCKHEHMEFETSYKCFNKNETNKHPLQYIQNILIMTNLVIKFKEFTNNPIKTNGRNDHTEDKKEGQKKAKERATYAQPEGTKIRERATPSYGRKLSHPQAL